MNDVAALEFTRQRAQPIPAERREELLATPGFGDVFSDHMVTVRWSAEVGWHDAQVGPLAAMSLHDVFTYPQPQAGPINSLGRKEWFEDPRHHL